MCDIKIDNREKYIIDLLKKKYEDFKFDIEQLDIGDIVINLEDYSIIIERKTIPDLISSIKDGRYKEQKVRLKSLNNSNNIIIYIIEGTFEKYHSHFNNRIPESTIWSVFVKLMVRDNFQLFRTNDINETAIFIKKLYEKYSECIKDKLEIKKENPLISYCNTIKIKKKDNVTPYICFIRQLSQIPGISPKIAKPIVDKYKSINLLIDAYNSHDSIKPRELLLKDIQISDKRKVGKKTSKKIHDYIFGLN